MIMSSLIDDRLFQHVTRCSRKIKYACRQGLNLHGWEKIANTVCANALFEAFRFDGK